MKVERLISIVMLLLEHKSINATKLAEMFEVSTRTIYRDIEAINQAGIPIVSYMGPNGGVGIMEEYKIDKRVFTTSDITTLLIGLGGARAVLTGDDFNNTLAKVKAMIPQEQLAELDFQTNQISIDLKPWSNDSRQDDYLTILRKAIADQQTVMLEYSNMDGSTSTREVEPYRLLLKGNSWYLQGYCLLRNETRTFKLYRIIQMDRTKNTFSPRLIDFAKMDAQLTIENPTVDVTIRFHENEKQGYVGAWGDNIISSFEDGYYTAKIQIVDKEYAYNVLLILGSCECIAPKKVRDYLIKRISQLSELYNLN